MQQYNHFLFSFTAIHFRIVKAVAVIAFYCIIFLPQSCTHNEQYIKSISSDIATHGFINDNCFQCIITAKPDPGIEGLVYCRESAHINLIQSIKQQCNNELFKAVLQLQNIPPSDSSMHQCMFAKLTPYIDKRVIVTMYYNEDHSQTAVVRIYEKGLKQKLSSLQCK